MTTDLRGLPGAVDEEYELPDGLLDGMDDRYRFRPWSELLNRPGPRWLVDGVLPAGGVGWLFGDPGTGKTFFAVDLSVAVAADCDDWHGFPISVSGPVRILLGEGHAGFPGRIGAAVLSRPEIDPDAVDIRILESPPNLLDAAAMLELSAQLQREDPQPALIVIDTWNACARGAEGAHSDTASVASACAALAALARDTGATVLVLDHPNKSAKDTPAGNFAKSAASDAMWAVKAEPETGHSILTCVKLKDAAIEGGELRFERVPLRKGEIDSPAYLRRVGDLVSPDDLNANVGLTLRALQSVSTSNGARDTEWKEVSLDAGVKKPTYYRAKARLIRHKLVEQKGNRFYLTPGGEALVSGGITEVSP